MLTRLKGGTIQNQRPEYFPILPNLRKCKNRFIVYDLCVVNIIRELVEYLCRDGSDVQYSTLMFCIWFSCRLAREDVLLDYDRGFMLIFYSTHKLRSSRW